MKLNPELRSIATTAAIIHRHLRLTRWNSLNPNPHSGWGMAFEGPSQSTLECFMISFGNYKGFIGHIIFNCRQEKLENILIFTSIQLYGQHWTSMQMLWVWQQQQRYSIIIIIIIIIGKLDKEWQWHWWRISRQLWFGQKVYSNDLSFSASFSAH